MAEQWSRLAESEMDRGVFVSTTISEQTTLDDLFKRYTQEILPSKKAQADAISRMKVVSSYLGLALLRRRFQTHCYSQRRTKEKEIQGRCAPSESRKMTVSSGARPSAIFLDSFTPA